MGYRRDPPIPGSGWWLSPRLVLILVALAQLYAVRGQLSIFHPNFHKMYSKTWHGGVVGGCSHGCTLDGWCRRNVEWHGPWGTTIVLDSSPHFECGSGWWLLHDNGTLEVSHSVERRERLKCFLYWVTKTWRSPWEAPTVRIEVAENDNGPWRRYPGTVVPEPH